MARTTSPFMLGPGSTVVVASAVGETDAVALADAEDSGADAPRGC